jgi:UDP-GlcNAc:undecaprenyl-phosphate GlcNAc-1-phosphate transferase
MGQISWEILYAAVFIEALLVSLALVPLAKRLGPRLGLIDEPKAHKIHTETKARSGGMAIYGSFVIVIVVDLLLVWVLKQRGFFPPHISVFLSNIPSVLPKLGAIIAGGTLMFVCGIIDDRHTLKPIQKLIFELIAAAILVAVGIRIVLFLPFGLGVFLSLLWVVLLTNSFNFLDNMDGLCGGVAAIILLVLALIAYQSGELFMVVMLLVLAGAVLGFLYYNYPPAKLFMGDGGSLFIGYMIAGLTMLATYYQREVPTRLPVVTPLIVLGVPIFDTISVILIRIKNRKPIMKGDTNHFSHRLVSIGMTRKEAVIFIYLVTLCVCLNALPLRYLSAGPSVVIAVQTLLLFVLIFILEKIGRRRNLSNSKT